MPSNKSSAILIGVGLVVALVVAISVNAVYKKITKEFHNATTPISVQEPSPGYICFLATGTDSVALSCMKK